MSVTSIIMAVLALLPAAGLLFYIYKMDRFDKEPIGLLIGLFFLGVGSVIPAIILELLAGGVLNVLFGGSFDSDAIFFSSTGSQYFYEFLNNFFCIALIEEACKWIFMFLITFKNKNFNCLFDGVVYSVFVSLGFAAAENILYVFQNGIGTALLRMVTAVPGHCFFAVLMGYYYSLWHIRRKAGTLERRLRQNNIISVSKPGFGAALPLVLSIAVPTFAHGFYDFCASVDSWFFMIIFFLFLGFLYFLCFRNVHKLSKADNLSSFISMDMVLKRYPQATKFVSTLPEYAQYFIPPTTQQQTPQQWNQPPMNQQQAPQQWNQPPMNQPQNPPQWNQPPMNQQQAPQQWNQAPMNQPQNTPQWNQPPMNQPQNPPQWNQPPMNQPQNPPQWDQNNNNDPY